MKITLISPYSDLQAFGIRTISACLKQEGHDVHLLFLAKYFTERYGIKTLNEIVKLSKESHLIGISLMTNYFDSAVQITQKLKENYDIPILWGGIHPTIRPEECLNYADIVCIGEGEESIVELSNKFDGGQDYYDIRGIWFKDKDKIITNPIRPLTQCLDNIPFPDYNYETHYILINERIHRMDIKLLNRYLRGVYVTMPTRGCPFGCAYCCNNTINKMHPNEKPLRKRSINNIIKELIKAKELLPFIASIKFDDDAFMSLSVKEIKEFCETYKKNVSLPLAVTGATPSTLTRDKLSLLVDAGLNFIKMGIQTGSERTKQLYNRRHTNLQVERGAKIINEFKDRIKEVEYDIILDNPWETEEDLIKTLMLLPKLATPYYLRIFSLAYYPGTELYIKAKMDGIITDDVKDVYRKDFLNVNGTYLNNIFLLLHKYAFNGFDISSKTMFLLTNQKMRQLKLHWLLYILLRNMVFPIKMKMKRIKSSVQRGLKDIPKGNWSRIHSYIRGYFFRIESLKDIAIKTIAIKMERDDFIEGLRDDMTFVLHPLVKLHTVFYLDAKKEIIFVKKMVGTRGKFNTRDSFQYPQLDDDLLLRLIHLFDSKDTLQEIRQRFCDQHAVSLTKSEFYEIVWLLNKHDIILDARNIRDMLAGMGGMGYGYLTI